MKPVVGRLAPSPTGALHLGNARSFLLAWLAARQKSGAILLRIEDIDSPRVKPWAKQQTIDDLQWLGLDWNFGPDIGGPHGSYIQSERRALYDVALDELRAVEAIYPCTCSRSEIAASASAPHESSDSPIYSGACSSRSVTDAKRFSPESFAWRFRSSHIQQSWEDRICGCKSLKVADSLGDFVIAKGDGTPAYQLAVVVDDQLMGVNEVLRGNDLVNSTFRQLDLLRQFGWDAPAYAHVPLMVGTDGKRLAKRHGDTRLSWFREQGIRAEEIIGYLAWTLNWIPEPQAISAAELLSSQVDWSLGTQPTTVELPKLMEQLARMRK